MRRDLLSAGVWYRFVQQQALQQHSPLWNWNKLEVLNPPQAPLLLPLLVKELLEHGVHHRHLWSKPSVWTDPQSPLDWTWTGNCTAPALSDSLADLASPQARWLRQWHLHTDKYTYTCEYNCKYGLKNTRKWNKMDLLENWAIITSQL